LTALPDRKPNSRYAGLQSVDELPVLSLTRCVIDHSWSLTA
jgi:hypothetical protein